MITFKEESGAVKNYVCDNVCYTTQVLWYYVMNVCVAYLICAIIYFCLVLVCTYTYDEAMCYMCIKLCVYVWKADYVSFGYYCFNF